MQLFAHECSMNIEKLILEIIQIDVIGLMHFVQKSSKLVQIIQLYLINKSNK